MEVAGRQAACGELPQGGILQVLRRPGTTVLCALCFSCEEGRREADAASPIVGMNSGGTLSVANFRFVA